MRRRVQFGTPLLEHTNSFDNAGRMHVVGDSSGHTATYSYVANSPLVEQIQFRQNGTIRMTTTKQYDLLN